MPIDHEEHKIRIKAVSDKMNHPMTYNDAGAPRVEMPKVGMERAARRGEPRVPGMHEERDKYHG